MKEIYLDNAATTKPLECLAKVYDEYVSDLWQNPSSLYKKGTEVNNCINNAKKDLLNAFNSSNHNCIFTSCGTESANTVILKGFRKSKNINFVCSAAEHPCVEESFKALEQQGFEVRYASVLNNGLAHNVASLVDENTALVSVMHINNETGAKNDICKIAHEIKNKNSKTLFHSDGVQAFLKEDLEDAQVIDYYTVSAHKVNAHKGTGGIFYKSGTPLKAYILGGGQENNLRSGTQNTYGILAFARACNYYLDNKNAFRKHVLQLNEVFMNICSQKNNVLVITPMSKGNACNHIVNLSAEGINAETLLHSLESEKIYISTGSACSSKKGKSRIAKALNLSQEIANGSIRISFSHFNTIEEVKYAANKICEHAENLKKYFKK